MMREWRLLLAAVQYFTRVPVPAWVGHSQEILDNASRYFPLVGAFVGVIGAAATWIAAEFWPLPVAVLLGMVATLLATGAFHEDGLADAVDGLGGGWTRERVLEIMRDSRIGTYGAAALGLSLLLKAALLSALPVVLACAALVSAHAASRGFVVLLMASLSYAREDESRAKPLSRTVSGASIAVASGTALVAQVALLVGAEMQGTSRALMLSAIALALLAAGVAMLGWRRLLRRRIGGFTGDTLGACQQLCELAIYLALVAVLQRAG